MKIVSWNIAGGHTFKGRVEDASSYNREDLSYFIGQIKDVESDVISLQEAHTSVNRNNDSQAKTIAEALGYDFVVNHPYSDRSHIKSDQRLSLSIISKLPIENSYFHLLPNPSLRITRPDGDVWVSLDVGFLVTTVGYNGNRINVANCHMVPYHYFNRDFLEFNDIRDDTSDFLIRLSKKPTLVAGDFNYNDLKRLLPRIFENGSYRESFEGVETAPGRGQQDHVLFSNQWDIRKYEIRVGEADHYLCVSEVELK
ncbi:MAG: endonuclease/exonuclease/phosphatase family protein [Candidatus Aenigmarchaeota archaeon]|nr:endonuclease/exonuclease/phosphatase family protein [Candidatus Aenigmarchaeota archaeon]